MKNLTIIFTLLFSTVIFSSPSYAKWTQVGTTVGGDYSFYVDFERIRKQGGYVYFWTLNDYSKLSPQGVLSAKVYLQGDCKLFRFQNLNYSFHNEPMGKGSGDVQAPVEASQGWKYATPKSMNEILLQSVCNR